MRPDLLDAPLSVNWLPVMVSVASPEASRQLITPVYVPDRSVCTPPSAPVGVAAAVVASAAAAARRRPRRWRRPGVPVPGVAIPPMFVFSPAAPPALALASPAVAFLFA